MEEKNRSYRGILGKTCSDGGECKGDKAGVNVTSLRYIPKIKRPGYLLGEELEEE